MKRTPHLYFFAARRVLAVGAVMLAALGVQQVIAHSVGQVQTTKFFAPQTVQMLKDRVTAGQPAGFQVGDTVTYIIQFTPVANNAQYGVNGYVTDYIPPGTQVVQASIVQKGGLDAQGNDIYYDIAPNLPGQMPTGFGANGTPPNTYLAPFNLNTYDSTGNCTASGLANAQCESRLTELYADTGIFYSTDPRTAQFPALPTRLTQAVNGYVVSPTREAALDTILGQGQDTTHNLWDAAMTNAFGTTNLPAGTPNANAEVGILRTFGGAPYGESSTPYRAGSAVAGPQSGNSLDYKALTGPWQRIAYAGSRIGDPTTGPSRGVSQNPVGNNGVGWSNATPHTIGIGGGPTALGYVLSSANPLPAGVNAVRWAVGKLSVGQISFTKITLRITQPIPAAGIVNGSEVFGGDASDLDGTAATAAALGTTVNVSIDNPWVYHVPSVADNNSNLFVSKVACAYDATATTCTPLGGTYTAASTTITYQITYLNTGNAVQTNVVLRDYLPCQTAASTQVRVGAVSGPQATQTLASLPYTTTTVAAGNCNTGPQTRSTVTFPTMTSLGPGLGGRLILNVPNNAATQNASVVNIANLVSAEVPGGVTSNAVTFVGTAANPALSIVKTAPVSTAVAGSTVQYVIVVQNTGTGAATTITFADVLPTVGGANADPTTRFNFVSTSSIVSSGFTTATALVVTTGTAATFTPALTPYNSQVGATNTVVSQWAFGAGSSLAPGGVITLTFVALVGSNVLASTTPYYNSVVATAGNPSLPTYRIDASNQAPITVSSNLGLSKTLACYYNSAGTCVPPSAAGTIPTNARVRYLVAYSNAGGAVASPVINDLLPCQLSVVAGSPTVTVTAVTGPIPAVSSPVSVSSGNCPGTAQTIPLGTATTLAANTSGSFTVEMVLVSPASTSTSVINQATFSAVGAASVTSQVQNTVLLQPNLVISKVSTPAAVQPGGTLSYTITVVNNGTTAAQTITVYDWLPTGTSTVADSTRRFSYTGTAVIAGGLTSVATTVNSSPTQVPYNSGTYRANQQEVVWSFGAQTLAVGATATIVFAAVAGANLVALPPPNYYYNNAQVNYYNTQQAVSNAASANVSNVVNLGITKINGVNAVAAGSTTTYTVTVSNLGPSAADGAVASDQASVGLNCTTVTCPAGSLTGGAACPVSLTNFFSTGVTIPTLPANSSVVFSVTCGVTATGR